MIPHRSLSLVFSLWEWGRGKVVLGLLGFVATFILVGENNSMLIAFLAASVVTGIFLVLGMLTTVCGAISIATDNPVDPSLSFSVCWAWLIVIFGSREYPDVGAATLMWGVFIPGIILWILRATLVLKLYNAASEWCTRRRTSTNQASIYPDVSKLVSTTTKRASAAEKQALLPRGTAKTGGAAFAGPDHLPWDVEQSEGGLDPVTLAVLLSVDPPSTTTHRETDSVEPWSHFSTDRIRASRTPGRA
jgi:hypothetical protein